MGVSNNLAGLTNMFKIVNKQDYLREMFLLEETLSALDFAFILQAVVVINLIHCID